MRHALVVGKFAPPHKGHQLLLETALRESERVTVLVYSHPDFLRCAARLEPRGCGCCTRRSRCSCRRTHRRMKLRTLSIVNS
ncbi:MAG: adenylyltransferase/cytidyltransferase family protein [Pleurocapsa sp. SU_196_0]|nr:adenylyltransferase/cytidyltransferase family protein [Pleurocapsa sp. SU_196_0]